MSYPAIVILHGKLLGLFIYDFGNAQMIQNGDEIIIHQWYLSPVGNLVVGRVCVCVRVSIQTNSSVTLVGIS